jgi:uncharacterized protein DUF3443
LRSLARYSRNLRLAALAGLVSVAAGCGGGAAHNSSTTSAPVVASGSNVQPISVNSGPAHNYANGVFTSVTVCVPGSSNCQTIDDVLVDTGSYGLRLLSSAGGGALTLSLPRQSAGSSSAVGECALFVSGYTWGPVASADITIAGEHASNVPVQVIDPTFTAAPSGCKNSGVPGEQSLSTLGANGILGIGPYIQDCGPACEQTGSMNPGLYYQCSSSSCEVAPQNMGQQVQNPVALFAKDNNGVIIQLPALSGSAVSLSGSMVFGIGTQSNNSLGSATIFPLDSSGEFTTTFKGKPYAGFVDSGSNAFFFLDAASTGLTDCPDNSGFYCPASPVNLSATTSSGGTAETINFSVVSASTLFANSSDYVFATLAGANPNTFDWGLPFFFGRNVYTAIEGHSTPAGGGPFWAY